MGIITAPEPLDSHQDIQFFDCGKPSHNNWLKKKALKAHRVGGSARTYVVCSPSNHVIGYYALATGSINQEDLLGKVKRNMPDPIPVILIARLAVDQNFKGQGIGSGLLKDAWFRIARAAKEIAWSWKIPPGRSTPAAPLVPRSKEQQNVDGATADH